ASHGAGRGILGFRFHGIGATEAPMLGLSAMTAAPKKSHVPGSAGASVTPAPISGEPIFRRYAWRPDNFEVSDKVTPPPIEVSMGSTFNPTGFPFMISC